MENYVMQTAECRITGRPTDRGSDTGNTISELRKRLRNWTWCSRQQFDFGWRCGSTVLPKIFAEWISRPDSASHAKLCFSYPDGYLL